MNNINIILRPAQEADLPIFFAQQIDPDAWKMAAFPAREHDAFMAHWHKILNEGTGIVRTILFEGNVAGNIVCWEASEKWHLGYWIGKEFWGKGIATAALAQFLDIAATRPLYAWVAKTNVASIRVLQKCGFTVCGEDRFTTPRGEPAEEYLMSLGHDHGKMNENHATIPSTPT